MAANHAAKVATQQSGLKQVTKGERGGGINLQTMLLRYADTAPKARNFRLNGS